MVEAYDEVAERTYRALGRFIAEFSQTEYALRYHLADTLNIPDEDFSAVVEGYDVAVLCTVVTSVFERRRASETVRDIKRLVNKFRELNDIRNRVAHGLWVPHLDGGTVHHTPRRSLKPIPAAANQADALEKLADEVRSIRQGLENAFTAFP